MVQYQTLNRLSEELRRRSLHRIIEKNNDADPYTKSGIRPRIPTPLQAALRCHNDSSKGMTPLGAGALLYIMRSCRTECDATLL